LLWPAPARNPVRTGAVSACRALAARLRAEVTYMLGDGSENAEGDLAAAVAASTQALHALQTTFFATPYRPTGLSSSARAVVRLVDELRWLESVVFRSTPKGHGRRVDDGVCRVRGAAAETLDAVADVLESPGPSSEVLHASQAKLHSALEGLESETTTRLPAAAAAACSPGDDTARVVVSSLDPSFRAQELSFVVTQIAANADYAAAADRRSWPARLLGRQPPGFSGALSAVQERAGAHVDLHSSWLHNSLRGAAALGLAVLVADLISVQHAFWVAFGTLSVLRSSALNTGQNTLRALAGTTVGFVIGGAIVFLIGTNTALLWVLLPIAVLCAGLAPAAVSFAAGQAAFTVTLLILFNILAPAGWKIGLVRVEDIAIGTAVSLAVGLFFWPRGAAVALGRALEQAYVDSADYLARAVAYGVDRCDPRVPGPARPGTEATRAAASSRRLDDTFRGYLSERGAKTLALAEVTTLVTGVAGVRLAGDAVLALWEDESNDDGDRAAARRELLSRAGLLTIWYDGFGASLSGRASVPDPLGAGPGDADRLVDAVREDLRDGKDLGDGEGNSTATAVRVIWTGDHLDAVRRLQDSLVGPARKAVDAQGLS
ncbi:MAG: FUSC family protein, partial [Solirubrobacteraceae bacterium]